MVSGALPRHTHLAIDTIPHLMNIRIHKCSEPPPPHLHPILNRAGPGTQPKLQDRKVVPRPFAKVPTAVGPCLALKDRNSTSPEVSSSRAYQVWVSCCRMWFLGCRSSSLPPPPALPQVPGFPPPGATQAGGSGRPDGTKSAQAGSSLVKKLKKRGLRRCPSG